ncbi:MAG: hypothetical protein WAW33_02725 [Minisyncoccia bacterium]
MKNLHKNLSKQPFFWTSICSLLAMGILVGLYSYAWISPTANPNSNAGSAINFSGGNVGIGTISPNSKLDVTGSVGIRAGNGLRLYNPADTDYATISLNGINVVQANYPWNFSGTGDHTITGSVGIGIADPVEKLEVEGNIKMTGTGNGITFPDGTKLITAVGSETTGYMITTVPGAVVATGAKSATGTILISPLYIPFTVNVNSMLLWVTTTLGANGDVGVYNSEGSLILNGGGGSLTTATGLKSIAPIQTGNSRTLSSGQYYVAITWNSITGAIGGANIGASGYIPRSGSITGGGSVLPSSISLSGIATTTYLYAVTLSGDDRKENGAICTNGSNCLSTYCYIDNDNDRYTGSSGTAYCRANASLGSDCYDTSASVNPGVTNYYTTNRGDGSFDYNCSGTEEKRYNCISTVSGCGGSITGITGWATSIPACGATGNLSWWTNIVSGTCCGQSTNEFVGSPCTSNPGGSCPSYGIYTNTAQACR